MVYLTLTTLIHVYLIQRYSREKIRLDWLSVLSVLSVIPVKIYLSAFLADSFTYFLVAWMSVFILAMAFLRRKTLRNLELSFFIMLINAMFYYISAGFLMIFNQNLTFEQVLELSLMGQNNYPHILMTTGLLLLVGVFRDKVPLEFEEEERRDRSMSGIVFILSINLIIQVMYYLQIPAGVKLILFVVLNATVLVFHTRNKNLRLQKARDRREIEDMSRSIQDLSQYIETIEGLTDRFKEFRHDVRNMMLGVGMEEYQIDASIEKVEEELRTETDHELFLSLRQVKYTPLKSLLYYYVMKGIQGDLNVTLNVIGEINGQGWKDLQFSRVLGILFENALEAALGSRERKLEIFVEGRDGVLNVIVGNTYAGDMVDLERLYEKGYSTHGPGRGTGLYGLQNILLKNNHFNLNTLIREGLFIQDLEISEEK